MGKAVRGHVKDRQDFSALLQSMKEEKSEQESAPAPEVFKSDPKPYTPSPARQRMLSDQSIQFALVVRGSGLYLHDKSCSSLKSVPDFAITWLKDYDPKALRCAQCELKAYLRLGARDPGRRHDYEKLYQDFNFHMNILRRMYVEDGMKTELIGTDTLKVWGKEDTWLIKRIPATERGLELYHNNYKHKWNGTRVFIPGYHLQCSGNSRKVILDTIAEYTYNDHRAALEKSWKPRVLPPPTVQVTPPISPQAAPAPGKPSLPARFFAWLKALFRF